MHQLFRDPVPWCEMVGMLFFPCIGIPTHFCENLETWRNKSQKLLLYCTAVQLVKADITLVSVNAGIVVCLSEFPV